MPCPIPRTAKVIVGVGICSYEAAALAANQPDVLPPITRICHDHPLFAMVCVVWVSQHLLLPWIRTCTPATSAPSATR